MGLHIFFPFPSPIANLNYMFDKLNIPSPPTSPNHLPFSNSYSYSCNISCLTCLQTIFFVSPIPSNKKSFICPICNICSESWRCVCPSSSKAAKKGVKVSDIFRLNIGYNFVCSSLAGFCSFFSFIFVGLHQIKWISQSKRSPQNKIVETTKRIMMMIMPARQPQHL